MDEKVKVITCGCRFNRYESAEIAKRLGTQDKPLVVINSCAVTARSEAKSRAAVRRAVRENPDANIVVSGCWAELEPEAVKAIKGVDLVLGNEEKFHMENFRHEKGSPPEVHTGSVNSATEFTETKVDRMEGRTVRYLKVQNGCDELCSFCVVRLARGKSRSASPQFVKERVAELIADGAGEIVLTGINVGQYGDDLPDGPNFAQLLKEIATGVTDTRFRISSINPNEVTEELLDVMASTPSICRYLHIPMQAGSTPVLAAMRRPYTAEEYRSKIELVAERLPGLALGCDVLAGFPGETEEQFAETAAMLRELPFTYAHVFPYSHRRRADSANLPGQIDEATKKQRAALLKEIAAEKNLAFRRSLIGSRMRLVVEERSGENGLLSAKSESFINVTLEGGEELLGKLVEAKAAELTEKGLGATLI